MRLYLIEHTNECNPFAARENASGYQEMRNTLGMEKGETRQRDKIAEDIEHGGREKQAEAAENEHAINPAGMQLDQPGSRRPG